MSYGNLHAICNRSVGDGPCVFAEGLDPYQVVRLTFRQSGKLVAVAAVPSEQPVRGIANAKGHPATVPLARELLTNGCINLKDVRYH